MEEQHLELVTTSIAIRHDALKLAVEVGNSLGYHSAGQYKELAESFARFVETGKW